MLCSWGCLYLLWRSLLHVLKPFMSWSKELHLHSHQLHFSQGCRIFENPVLFLKIEHPIITLKPQEA
jgi:hypothetical protein